MIKEIDWRMQPMLKEKALYYYMTLGKCCADSILCAGNEEYGLNIAPDDLCLFTGFCGGMACGDICGCLAGAIGVLSKKYAGRENFKEICKNFVSLFREELGCDSTLCAVLEPKYKTPELRCSITVGLAADVLSAYIAKLDA